MQRLRRVAFPLALAASLVIAVVVVVEDSAARPRTTGFTSRNDHLRLVVPGAGGAATCRATPGLLANGWPRSSRPGAIRADRADGRAIHAGAVLLLAAICRVSRDGLPAKYACALRGKLRGQRMRVGPIQPGRARTTRQACVDLVRVRRGKHFPASRRSRSLRTAVSLVLAPPTSEARAIHTARSSRHCARWAC